MSQCWEQYYAGKHKQFEASCAKLRRLSPHHSRALYDELADLGEDV